MKNVDLRMRKGWVIAKLSTFSILNSTFLPFLGLP